MNVTYIALIWELIDEPPAGKVGTTVRRIIRVRSLTTLCAFAAAAIIALKYPFAVQFWTLIGTARIVGLCLQARVNSPRRPLVHGILSAKFDELRHWEAEPASFAGFASITGSRPISAAQFVSPLLLQSCALKRPCSALAFKRANCA